MNWRTRCPHGGRGPLRVLDDRAMEFASSDDELRAALFRFVDVVPACHSVDDLARHLTGFLEDVDDPPPSIEAAMRMGSTRVGRAALGAAAAVGVKRMAHRFIVGEDVSGARGVLRGLWREGVASSVDLLGEATVTADEADRYAARCASALDDLAGVYDGLAPAPLLERDAAGPTPRVNLSVKTSALTPLLRPDAPDLGRRDAAERLRPLLRRARDARRAPARRHGEPRLARGGHRPRAQPARRGRVPRRARRRASSSRRTCATRRRWRRDCSTGAPRRRARTPLTIRLVKGAYWDHEIIEARQHGWTAPVFELKSDSDRTFETLTRDLLEARSAGAPVRVAIASHNLRSVAHALAANARSAARPQDVEIQVLRGLGDDLQHALSTTGHRVRTYCPVGDLVAGMAYLVRRLLENTSNESFLHDQVTGVPIEELLRAP